MEFSLGHIGGRNFKSILFYKFCLINDIFIINFKNVINTIFIIQVFSYRMYICLTWVIFLSRRVYCWSHRSRDNKDILGKDE